MRLATLIGLAGTAACSFAGQPGSGDGDGDGDGDGADAAAVSDSDARSEPTCTSPPPDIIAWWDGDGALGADRTGNYTGTVARGEPSIEADGFVGQTTHFDNNEELGFDPAPTPSAFTVEAWIRRTGEDNDYRTIYGAFADSGLFLFEHRLAFWDRSMNSGFGGHAVEGITRVPVDTWSHVAATWDGETARVYLDGTLEAETTPGVSVDLPDPARAGGVSDGFGDNQSFRGDLDELTLYSRALSASEVGAIASAARLGKCK